MDAIQELTLERSTYDAQYGRSGGGQIVVATKSGTSQFHGDAYEFVRNNAFNANDFFANYKGLPRAIERYNDFGFTLGGPLFIPKLYPKSESKTFFFWSEEWRKSHQPGVDVATVPTSAELNGTFAGKTLNPASAPAGCITNTGGTGQVNPACFSNNANVYIKNVYSKFPADVNGQSIANVSSLNNYRQDIVRLDQNISDKVHAFARYMQDVVPTTEPGGLFAGSPLPGISSTATNAPGRNLVANVSWTISPTIVNETAFNYSWGAINSNPTGVLNSPAFVGALSGGLPYTDPYGRVQGVSITGFSGIAIPAAPYFERNIDKTVYDNFSKVWGNHTIRLGATASWMVKTENE
ncbi:MAG: TonB-dependent receptor, partial [Bryobacteraceae bacterium]